MSVQAIISTATGFVSGSNVFMMALVENKTVYGRIKKLGFKFETGVCYYYPASEDTELIDVTKWNLKQLVLTPVAAVFPYGCIQTWGCTTGGTAVCSSWDGGAGSLLSGIPVRAANATAPGAVPGFTVTPSNGALTLTWGQVADPTGGEVFAYDIYVYDGAALVAGGFADAGQRNVTIGGLTNGRTYTVKIRAVSHNGLPGAYATATAIPVGATNPVVYDIQTTPASPKAGESTTITASLANTGPDGKVRAVFKVDGAQISDQNSTLNAYPGGGLWQPAAPYTMPNKTITIAIDAYGWDGTKWVLTDSTKSITRTPAVTPCSSVTLTPFSASIQAAEKVTFTAAVTPATSPFTVQFKDRAGTLLGTCTTSGGNCTFIWDSAGKPTGTYYVRAYAVEGSCVSTESAILLSPAIRQWNVSIYARDSVTGAPVEGATVMAGTQSKVTDATGLALFRVDEGTITISISKTGYTTFNTIEPVFSDKTFNYPVASTAAPKGSIQFVSVPVGVKVWLAPSGQTPADQKVRTPITITDLPAGKYVFVFTLAGFNDTTGEVTVTGGGVVQAYATLTPISTTGGLSFYSTPQGAQIFINDVDQKMSTPTTITGLAAGTYRLKLTLANYQDWTGTVDIKAGQTTYLSPVLTPLTTIGALEINTVPQGARVFLDGIDQFRITPATILNLPPRSYDYKLVLGGFSDASGKAAVEAGKTTVLNVTMKKPGPGAGTVVLGLMAAGVLGAVILRSGKQTTIVARGGR